MEVEPPFCIGVWPEGRVGPPDVPPNYEALLQGHPIKQQKGGEGGGEQRGSKVSAGLRSKVTQTTPLQLPRVGLEHLDGASGLASILTPEKGHDVTHAGTEHQSCGDAVQITPLVPA